MKVISSDVKKQVRIGLVGYSGQKFNEDKAKEFIKEAFDKIASLYKDKEILLVSGWSDMGIPALGYREAQKRGWKTVGVACEKINDYDKFPCEETHIVGKDWGDESNFFLDMLDAMVKVGGGKQSEREAESAKEWGMPVFEYELKSEK